MIAMYDMDDNLLFVFNTRQECAKYFDRSVRYIDCVLCKFRNEYVKKKRDFKNRRWVKLVEVYDE